VAKPTWKLPENWDTHGQRRLVPMSFDMFRARAIALVLIIAVAAAAVGAGWIWDALMGWVYDR
jgi:hypothetical protein